MRKLRHLLIKRKKWNYWKWATYILALLWVLGFFLPLVDDLHTFKCYEYPNGKRTHVIEKINYFGINKYYHYYVKEI